MSPRVPPHPLQSNDKSVEGQQIVVHHIRMLGDELSLTRLISSTSFSSESPQPDCDQSKGDAPPRFLVCVAEKFKFRIPLQLTTI